MRPQKFNFPAVFFLAGLFLYPSSLTLHYQPPILLSIHSVHFISVCKQNINLLPRANTTKSMAWSLIRRLDRSPDKVPYSRRWYYEGAPIEALKKKEAAFSGSITWETEQKSLQIGKSAQPCQQEGQLLFCICQYISKKVSLFQKEPFITSRHNPCDIAHTGCTIAEYDGAWLSMCCGFLPPLSPFHTTDSQWWFRKKNLWTLYSI